MISFKTATSQNELEQILALQKANLPMAVSKEEQQAEGFVTVHHDFDILKRMNEACAHTLAKDGEKVVGYALSMHPKFGDEIEVLRPMFKQIRDHLPTDVSYVIMVQICIDKAYRKQGIFRKLYEAMKEHVNPEFEAIITEVDTRNVRSLYAHHAVGFRLLHRYYADGRDWELIILK